MQKIPISKSNTKTTRITLHLTEDNICDNSMAYGSFDPKEFNLGNYKTLDAGIWTNWKKRKGCIYWFENLLSAVVAVEYFRKNKSGAVLAQNDDPIYAYAVIKFEVRDGL